MRCLLCSGTAYQEVGITRDCSNFHVVQCHCGFLQIDPMPTAEENTVFYQEGMQEKNFREIDIEKTRHRSSPDTYRRVGWLEDTKKDGTILDVGCGYGFFVELASLSGYVATGIDVSLERIGIPHKCGNFISGELKGIQERFDILTAFHVLEHMIDPVSFLRECCKRAKILLIEVPCHSDILMETCKPYRDFRWQRAHISYFTEDTLSRLFTIAGLKNFTIKTIQRYGVGNVLNWLQNGIPQKDDIDWCGHELPGVQGDTIVATIYENK